MAGESHTASVERRTYSVGCGICSRPGATRTGPVRRGASARKQDKSPGADGESNSSGREEGNLPLKEKKIVPVAVGRHRGTGCIPPAAADRVLIYERATIVVLEQQPHRSQRHRPVRRGAPNSKVGVYEEEFPTWKGPVTECGYVGPGVAPEHRGGRRDMRQLSWSQSSGIGTPRPSLS